jgi:hypothetical protein
LIGEKLREVVERLLIGEDDLNNRENIRMRM